MWTETGGDLLAALLGHPEVVVLLTGGNVRSDALPVLAEPGREAVMVWHWAFATIHSRARVSCRLRSYPASEAPGAVGGFVECVDGVDVVGPVSVRGAAAC